MRTRRPDLPGLRLPQAGGLGHSRVGIDVRYLQRPGIDPLRDGVTYRLAGQWLDDAEYAGMIASLEGSNKGVEVDWMDAYTKTVVIRPEGGCAACAISTFHIQKAIGAYLAENVDPEIRVIVKAPPQADF